MQEIKVTFKNGYVKNYPFLTPVKHLIQKAQKSCSTEILGARINNEIVTEDTKLKKDCEIDFLDINDPYGYRMYQAALKFIFEVAIKEVFQGSEVNFLHSVPKGIMSEIIYSRPIVKEDLIKIKEAMVNMITNNEKIEKFNIAKKEAIKYFNHNHQYEKAKNIHNSNTEIVSLYKLKTKYNYYYSEMPSETKLIKKFDLIYLGDNKIVIVYPSSRSNGLTPEYVHYSQIINTFEEGRNWLKIMNAPYLANINELVSSSKIESFIKVNELVFNDHISNVAKEIAAKKDIKMILISGPSSTGKTTTTKRLSTYLEALGYQAIPISVDNYYKDEEEAIKDHVENHEVIEALDLEMFNKDINELIQGKVVYLPTYDFTSHKKTRSSQGIKMTKKSILLVEGLHCLNDDLTKDIENKYKFKIYLSPFISLAIDRHNYLSTVDLRLLRRIIRDNRTRNTTVSETIEMWQTVRDGEEKYIFPYIHQADVVINTSYAFEVGVLKVFAEPLLYSVGLDSPYYEEARRLINSMRGFYPISSEYISKDSILREFIG